MDPTQLDRLEPLLRRVVAVGPATLDELVEVAESIGWDGGEAVGLLVDLGAIEVAGGSVVLHDPVKALTARASGLLDAERAALSQVEALLAVVPRLASSAAARTAGDMIGDVVSGHNEVWDSWWRNAAALPPRRPGVVTPDAVMLRSQVLADIDRVAADFVARGYHMRVLLDVTDCFGTDGSREEWLQALLDAGVEVRAMPNPPSWFYVDDGVIGGIPLTWGQGNPAGMVILRASPLLELAAAYFETLWTAAVPVGTRDAGWEPVLRLLAVGRSDKQIGDARGLSLRTVRRRIAEAMDELAAPTRFELGAAWARRAP